MRHAMSTRTMSNLAAAALAAGILAWVPGQVLASGTADTYENHPDVRIFAPTPLARDIEAHEPVVPQPVNVVVHVQFDALALNRAYRRAVALELRKDRIHRAFGHRYTGFIKMYRGPRYPF